VSELARELTELVRNLAETAEAPPDGELIGLWSQVQELGLVTIGIPEDDGGSGGELADLLVVVGELARTGIATPIVEACTAAFAIGPSAPGRFDTVTMNHVVDGGMAALNADLGVVPFAGLARRVVILGDTRAVAMELADVTVVPAVDMAGLPGGRVRLEHTAGVRMLDVDPRPMVERLALARAASLIGNCRGAYELTRSYVIDRRQFGAPLVEIPSVATTLAQMAVRIRFAQSALDHAVTVAGEPGSDALNRFGAAVSARIVAAQAATLVARATHQLHGAVGITREYGLQRFTRSLWAQRDADQPEREWARRLGAGALAVDEDALWEQLTA
jgi:acyl-CoA dehydrogenase